MPWGATTRTLMSVVAQLLAIDDRPVVGRSHNDIVSILAEVGREVTLSVLREDVSACTTVVVADIVRLRVASGLTALTQCDVTVVSRHNPCTVTHSHALADSITRITSQWVPSP